MGYCVQADLEAAISAETVAQLADDDADGVADEAVVARAIADADAEINSYLSARYTVPLSPVPALAKKLSIEISVWNLYGHRRLVDELSKQRYDAAVALLKLVAKGDATIGVDPEPSGGEQSIQTGRTADDRTFTIGKKSTSETGNLDNY